MQLISRSIAISFLLTGLVSILTSTPLLAQSNYLPHAVRVGTDLYGIGRTFFGEDRERFEINADLAIDKYFFVADFGIDNIDLSEERFSYANDGRYFRVGADVNFTPGDEDNNVIFFGARYARSYFNDKLVWNATEAYPKYDVPEITSSNNDLKGRWFELVVGMKVNIWKELFVGYTIRYKFYRNVEGEGILEPYEMPGFGVYEKESRVGFNYQVFWRIPFKKNPTPDVPLENN